VSKTYATINPCSMCMPMGSVIAFKGIENSMTLFHGSQGCSTYIRLYLAHHFREPVDIGSSALSQEGAVYGGAANLKQGLRNIIQGYTPTIVGVSTTCLAETIGDDVPRIIHEFQREEPAARDIPIIHVSTPSYAGTHEEGYAETLKAIVKRLATRGEPHHKCNLIIGSIVSPADVRYLKDVLERWPCDCIVFPDISETFDAPIVTNLPKIVDGGTPLSEIRDMANSTASITIGGGVWRADAGALLRERFGVPHVALSLPIGIEYTDDFVVAIEGITGRELPRRYERERGRLLDALVDAHKIVHGIKAAVYGDTELALGITKLLSEIGVDPSVVATGATTSTFAQRVRALSPGATVLYGADFTHVHKEITKNNVQIMIGPSTGRQIAQKESIPLLRVGLPISDRFGAARQTVMGYKGMTWMVDALANALLDAS